MKKKIIGIFMCFMLIITTVSISAFNDDLGLHKNDTLANDIVFDVIICGMFISDPCIAPDNGYGTVDLPALCPYIAPGDPFYIIEGLNPGSRIELDPTLDSFENMVNYPGGPLGGEVLTFDATLELSVIGTGDLHGFNRNLATPVSIEIHTGPRISGDPVQTFPSDLFQLSGEIFGDPDFCTFRINAGSDYGLPSPGQFTLTKLPTGDFNIDSFFDITYQIEFEGCPGSILEGLSGSTIETTRIQQGIEADNTPPNTPSQPSGPTSVTEGIQYDYTTSTTDPDGDAIIYGFDFNNDGIIEPGHWSLLIPSGATYTAKITFFGTGTRYLRVKAEDIHGAQSDFSSALVIMVTGANNPPNTPNIPSGPNSGNTGSSLTFSTSTTDPDDDSVRYGWDWDGDNTVDEWSGLLSSGSTDSRSHTWIIAGTYDIQVKAEDSNGGQSAFSTPKTVVISSNSPPDKPGTPSGPSSGRIGSSYSYSTSTDDSNGDQVYYQWDFGDDISDWDGPYNSGTSVSTSHIWSNQGTYAIKVKAKDEHGVESVWSNSLSVTLPKNKSLTNPLIQFLQNFPNLFSLLGYIISIENFIQ